MNKSVGLIAAFLGGAAVGGALGVLFAPQSGEETRRKIAAALEKRGIKLGENDLNDFINDVENLTKYIERFKKSCKKNGEDFATKAEYLQNNTEMVKSHIDKIFKVLKAKNMIMLDLAEKIDDINTDVYSSEEESEDISDVD